MLGEGIRLTDGMLAPIHCASVSSYRKCDDCADENNCAIRHAMIEVRNATGRVIQVVRPDDWPEFPTDDS